jgi:hypothetical protein
MKVTQAKLAQPLRGESSNIIDDKKYDLHFDKGMLHAKLKLNPKEIGPFIIFPANIAFLEYKEHKEEITPPAGQEPEQQLPKGKAKK